MYNGFVSRYPAKKAGIDTVFAAHGFYRDTDRETALMIPGNLAPGIGGPEDVCGR